eukprot:sb/3478664/
MPVPKPRVELGDLTQHNLQQLKVLNQVVFPVSYNDKFYKDVLEVGELAKLAGSMIQSHCRGPCWLMVHDCGQITALLGKLHLLVKPHLRVKPRLREKL